MKEFVWSDEKNEHLKKYRDISFERLIDSTFVGIENHRTKQHQQLMLFELRNYIWVVPYVESEKYFFLKTAFPSRKYTKKYLGRDVE